MHKFQRLVRVARRAALEYLAVSGRAPHIIHLHEWQARSAADTQAMSRIVCLTAAPH